MKQENKRTKRVLPKQVISIHLEPALTDWFKENSKRYTTHMRLVLESYAENQTQLMREGKEIQIKA